MYWLFIAACDTAIGGKCVMLHEPEPFKSYAECRVIRDKLMNSQALEARLRKELATVAAIKVNGLCATSEERDKIEQSVESDKPDGLVDIA